MIHAYSDFTNVPGFVGYQVNRNGDVRSLIRNIVLKPKIDKKGYASVTLFIDGRRHYKFVHTIVLETFVGPCPETMQACHSDGDPTNNRLDNLRWGTKGENEADKKLHGTATGNTPRPVRRSDGVEFDTMTQAAKRSGCRKQDIWRVCNGRRKTTGGYGWRYV